MHVAVPPPVPESVDDTGLERRLGVDLLSLDRPVHEVDHPVGVLAMSASCVISTTVLRAGCSPSQIAMIATEQTQWCSYFGGKAHGGDR